MANGKQRVVAQSEEQPQKQAKKVKIQALEPCDTEGCEEPAITKGRCSACYQGMRRLHKQDLSYLTAYLYTRTRLVQRGREAVADVKAAAAAKRRRAA